MSIQDLPKTLVLTAVKLVRIPLELIERAIPGRGDDRKLDTEPLEPDPGIRDKPTPTEGLKPDPDAPKPRKPAAKRASSTAKKPVAKKASTAKKPTAKKKPAAKRSTTPKPKNTTAAEEPGVVDEATDGLEAATDRAVTARSEIEQAAEASGNRR